MTNDDKVAISRTALKTLMSITDKELIRLSSEAGSPEKITAIEKAVQHGRSALNG